MNSFVDAAEDWTDIHDDLAPLADFERSLRCAICGEFYRDPVTAEFAGGCPHNFCSFCCRQQMGQLGLNHMRCPQCKAELKDTVNLKKNRALASVVNEFVGHRPKLLATLRKWASSSHSDISSSPTSQNSRISKQRERRKSPSEELDYENVLESKKRMKKRAKVADDITNETDTILIEDFDVEGKIYSSRSGGEGTQSSSSHISPSPGVQPVECPLCNKLVVSLAHINNHIDSGCKIYVNEPNRPSTPLRSAHNGDFNGSIAHHVRPPSGSSIARFFGPPNQRRADHEITAVSNSVDQSKKYLPSVPSSSMQDRALRRKCWELGIPQHGDRKIVEQRLVYYRNLYNSNLDRDHPRSNDDLLIDLSAYEATQLNALPENQPFNVSTKHEDSVDDQRKRTTWLETHRNDFSDLIARAKATRQKKAEKATPDSVTSPHDTRYVENSEEAPHEQQV
ncbi:hypothetical protein BJ742DRAFT_831462 [Cladochytrium replicatum]|nr:hypothetical protein BJ742DRAFT_831462 [Cladochytrium replicatum]